jgi:glycosyltransferase involved in cell wall biosynthesis
LSPRACFFSNESLEQLQKEQYSLQDIRILRDLGYQVTIATSFGEIPLGCDLYFSWWASGSILPLVKARLSSKPIIVVAGGNEAMFYRDSISDRPLGYLATPWYKKLATRLCLRLADQVLTVSGFMVEDVRSLGAHEPEIVHNSVDTMAFDLAGHPRAHLTSIFNLDEHVVTVKRGDVLLRALPLVLKCFPDQRLAIIGRKGDAFRRLEQLVRDLGVEDHVDFIGSIANSEVAGWLQRSIAYVQVSDTETFGVAVGEAMSCGTPVVVSRRGALPELVGDCGIYVDHNDPASVAAGIVEVLGLSDDDRRRLGLAARRRIEQRFTYEIRRARIQRVISSLRG